MRSCTKCGHSLADNVSVCDRCGEVVRGASSQQTPRRPPPPPLPPGRAGLGAASSVRPPTKRPPPPPAKGTCKLDSFGNPEGSQFGLARDGEFAGKRLLVWVPDADPCLCCAENPLWPALTAKGFRIVTKTDQFRPEWLAEVDQLWLFAGRPSRMDARGYAAVEAFINSGRGAYLAAENDPFVAEVAELTRRLYGVTVKGNYPGTKIGYVKTRGLTAQEQVAYGAGYQIDDHPLFSGLNFIYEGDTVSHVEPTPLLKPVFCASDGQTLAATSRKPGQRVLIDCGYTRYYYHPTRESLRLITRTAGTVRYAQNITAHLMGKSW